MKRNSILASLLLFFAFSLFAQTKGEVFTVEALVCDSVGTAIKDVAVCDAKNNLRSITDQDGVARIATRLGETLYFSHVSFNNKLVRIEKKDLIEDTKGRHSMLVVMRHKTNKLQEVTVTENAAHLAYENKTVWVMDYKVQDDGIYMVAGNGNASTLLHLDFEQDTISLKPIASKYQELYQDAFGNLHLIGPDSTYQIYCDGKQLHLLYGTGKEVFRQKLEPVKIVTDSIMVLQNYANMQQQLVYLMVNRNNKQISVMADLNGTTAEMARNARTDVIRDQKMDMLEAEFQEMPPIKGVTEGTLRSNFKTDEIDVERRKLMVKNFYNRIRFKPIYCPAIPIENSIYIFDFQNNNLLKYDNLGHQISTCGIDFHKTGYFKNLEMKNPWDEKLIVDAVTGQCFAQFSSDGIVTLKEIDLYDGKVKREIRLTDHSFPQNIQVYNGEVYYLFLNNTQTTRDRRSLYKMRLE
ncbi:MAG: hypothetical protein IKO23_12720 [Bacteroidales bacterium]|nr:hypothetical protein [Bacteroidales bacterium]